MNRPKRIVLISVVALVVVGVIAWFKLTDNHQTAASFQLEVGYTESDAGLGIEHPGTRFPIDKPLLVLAMYAPNQSSSSLKSILTVLSKNTQEVVQKEEWTENREVRGKPVKLQNSKWKPGTYLLRWEREGQELVTQELVLE